MFSRRCIDPDVVSIPVIGSEPGGSLKRLASAQHRRNQSDVSGISLSSHTSHHSYAGSEVVALEEMSEVGTVSSAGYSLTAYGLLKEKCGYLSPNCTQA